MTLARRWWAVLALAAGLALGSLGGLGAFCGPVPSADADPLASPRAAGDLELQRPSGSPAAHRGLRREWPAFRAAVASPPEPLPSGATVTMAPVDARPCPAPALRGVLRGRATPSAAPSGGLAAAGCRGPPAQA